MMHGDSEPVNGLLRWSGIKLFAIPFQPLIGKSLTQANMLRPEPLFVEAFEIPGAEERQIVQPVGERPAVRLRRY